MNENIELIVEEFEERLFEELEKLKPVQKPVMMDRKKDVHFIMKEATHRKMKMWCAGEGITFSDLMEELAVRHLTEKGRI
jgi:hypothetical protein